MPMYEFHSLQLKNKYLLSLISLAVIALVGYLALSGKPLGFIRAQSSLSSQALQPFTGQWHFDSSLLTVDNDGHAVFIARAYKFCAAGVAQPCDAWQGNTIIPGIREDILINKIDGSTAHGTIVSSTDEKTNQQVTLTLQPHDTLQFENRTLCGPNGPAGYCGV